MTSVKRSLGIIGARMHVHMIHKLNQSGYKLPVVDVDVLLEIRGLGRVMNRIYAKLVRLETELRITGINGPSGEP